MLRAATGRLLGLAAVALVLGLAHPARAERIAVVVGGEPGKAPHVIDAIAPWLTDRGHTPVLDALDDDATGRLVACFLDDDDACAADVVRAAAGPATLDRLLFVMVDLEQVVAGTGPDAATVDNVTLTGLLFDATGAERRAERRLCEACRIAALATAATDLAAAALGAADAAPGTSAVTVTSSPAGAAISVDGKPAGTTPATLALAPGTYTLRLTRPGHLSTEQQLVVAPGTPASVDLSLAPLGPGAHRASRLLPFSLLAAGAALAITGGVLVAVDEDAVTSGDRPPTYRDSATAGVVVGAIGVAAVGAGVYLLLRSPTAARQVAVTPTRDAVLLGWRGSF